VASSDETIARNRFLPRIQAALDQLPLTAEHQLLVAPRMQAKKKMHGR